MSFEADRDRNISSEGNEAARHLAAVLNFWTLQQPPDAAPRNADWIFAAIETEIVPRLVLASEPVAMRKMPVADTPADVTEAERSAFLKSLLNDSAIDAQAQAQSIVGRGVPLESVFVDLLAWSARRLGEYWEEDLCSFTDVTIGLCRLHETMHHLQSAETRPAPRRTAGERRILIGNAPGEQHVFGAVMVAEFFRRDGWTVYCEPGSGPDALCRLAGEQEFDVIGLSASTDSARAELVSLIGNLRAASRNADVRVMAGGPVFAENQALAAEIGADLIANDGRTAPELARNMLAMP
ncbi:B12-binding domain-containing protein [Hyphomonas sp.]|uniref:cobalamin B12-binding domain-containing protein n=1 Tax=Hyphomonas sp. TaxID=87 RepID=UPI00391BB22F